MSASVVAADDARNLHCGIRAGRAPVLVGTHDVLKAWTFPVPPREAGWFDAGPMVGAWFTVVSVLTWRAALQRETDVRLVPTEGHGKGD